MPNPNPATFDELLARKEAFMKGYNKGWNACLDAAKTELCKGSGTTMTHTFTVEQRLEKLRK